MNFDKLCLLIPPLNISYINLIIQWIIYQTGRLYLKTYVKYKHKKKIMDRNVRQKYIIDPILYNFLCICYVPAIMLYRLFVVPAIMLYRLSVKVISILICSFFPQVVQAWGFTHQFLYLNLTIPFGIKLQMRTLDWVKILFVLFCLLIQVLSQQNIFWCPNKHFV